MVDHDVPSIEGGGTICSPPDGASSIRGLDLLAALDFVNRRGGLDLMTSVLANLSIDDVERLSERSATSGRLPALKWYPFGLHCRLLRSIHRELSPEEPDILFTMGEHMARRDIPRVFRTLLSSRDPSWPVRLIGRMWRMYHDRGSWDVENSDGQLIAKLVERPETDRLFCMTFTGWATGALRLLGASDAHVHHAECRANMCEACVFVGRWTPKSKR